MEHEPAGEIAQPHRKERRRKVSDQPRLEIEWCCRRPPDVDLQVGPLQGPEKPEPQDMIHVEVCEENVHACGAGFHAGSERSNARPRVEHEQRPSFPSDLHAGSIAAVAEGAWPWTRQ